MSTRSPVSTTAASSRSCFATVRRMDAIPDRFWIDLCAVAVRLGRHRVDAYQSADVWPRWNAIGHHAGLVRVDGGSTASDLCAFQPPSWRAVVPQIRETTALGRRYWQGWSVVLKIADEGAATGRSSPLRAFVSRDKFRREG